MKKVQISAVGIILLIMYGKVHPIYIPVNLGEKVRSALLPPEHLNNSITSDAKSLFSEYLVQIAQAELKNRSSTTLAPVTSTTEKVTTTPTTPSTTTVDPFELVSTVWPVLLVQRRNGTIVRSKPTFWPSLIRRGPIQNKTTDAAPETTQTTAAVETSEAPKNAEVNLRKMGNGLDKIEDAILAALETANTNNGDVTAGTGTAQQIPGVGAGIPSQNPNVPGVLQNSQQFVASAPGANQNLHPNIPNGVYPGPLDQQGLVNGQILQLANGQSLITTTTHKPGEYIAGIFGSLAQANLAGVADNTFKLLATSGVQNFFAGIADQVTCGFSAECLKQREKQAQK